MTRPWSRQPTPATFLGGVAVAFALAAAGAVLFASLTPLLAPGLAIRTIATLLGGAYLVYLLSRSAERAGRVVTVAAWLIGAGAAALFVSPLPLFLVCHAAMIWLIRTLYFHGSIATALLDLGLAGIALAAAIWAAKSSSSVFLAVWCFFLVQALFVGLPADASAKARSDDLDDQPFERARRNADAALRRLTANVHHLGE
jgi:hypothetical protein